MSAQATIHVSLTPELNQFVQDRIAAGQFQNADEAVQEGLELLRQQETGRQEALRALQAKLQRGAEQAQRGELLEGPEVMRQLRARARGRRDRKAS